MKNTPEFIMIGAAKSGTTAVYEYLKQHPQVFMPDFKEPHYFVSDKPLNFPVIDNMDDYETLFENAEDKIKGEASTGYLYFPEAAKRIHKELPKAKIIALVRNPVDRAFSMWGHQIRESLEPLDFETAVRLEMIKGKRKFNAVEFGFNYLQLGKVSEQLREYIQLFGKENVFIGDYEDLKRDPEGLMKSIFEFLNVDPFFSIQKSKPTNVSGQPKFPMLHQLLNSKSPIRKLIVKPFRWVLCERIRHLIWKRIRDSNIRSGNRHILDEKLRSELLLYFKTEQEQLTQLM